MRRISILSDILFEIFQYRRDVDHVICTYVIYFISLVQTILMNLDIINEVPVGHVVRARPQLLGVGISGYFYVGSVGGILHMHQR